MQRMKANPTAAVCPGCGESMFQLANPGIEGVVAVCAACAGFWVDNVAGTTVMTRALGEDVITFVRELVAKARAEGKRTVYRARNETTRRCPVCREDLAPTRLSDPVIDVDVCTQHGTYFDRGELGLVMQTLEVRQLQGLVDATATAAENAYKRHLQTFSHSSGGWGTLISLGFK